MRDAERNGLFFAEKARWCRRASHVMDGISDFPSRGRLDQEASPLVAIEPAGPSSSSPVVESLAATLSDCSLAD